MLHEVAIFAMGSVSFGHVHCRLLCIFGNDVLTTIENLKQSTECTNYWDNPRIYAFTTNLGNVLCKLVTKMTLEIHWQVKLTNMLFIPRSDEYDDFVLVQEILCFIFRLVSFC